jgi:hypothetical protein
MVATLVSARPRPRSALVAWSLWALVILGVAGILWLDQLLRQTGRPDLVLVTPDAVAYLVGLVSAASVGALLASRRPRHPVGWLLLTLGLSVAAAAVATGCANYGLLAKPGSLPAAGYAAIYHSVDAPIWAACLSFILLLTPTGSLPSPRWRWFAAATVAAAVLAVATSALLPFEPPYQSAANPLAVAGLEGPLWAVNNASWLATALVVPVSALSLVLRFRRARGTERQQLRWLALAAALMMVVVVVVIAAAPTGNPVVLGWLTAGCVALLPLATGAAILRYRLYDLDRIISRTVAYGMLTVLLGGGYAVVVLGLGQLLGRDSSLVVAGATLAVAAAFRPARRRVQSVVDRRFDRRRYDAAREIAAFSARLRQQVDLDTLTAELLSVVDQTMQPTVVSLWLRPN